MTYILHQLSSSATRRPSGNPWPRAPLSVRPPLSEFHGEHCRTPEDRPCQCTRWSCLRRPRPLHRPKKLAGAFVSPRAFLGMKNSDDICFFARKIQRSESSHESHRESVQLKLATLRFWDVCSVRRRGTCCCIWNWKAIENQESLDKHKQACIDCSDFQNSSA